MNVRIVARRGRVIRLLAAVGLLAGATTAGAFAVPGSAVGSERFASASNATIHPGVMLNSEAGQCTANFVFTSGDKVYIGAAAHCAGKGRADETDGCTADTYGLGTKFEIDGADHDGVLVYSSWITMQDDDEKDQNLCAYNDFALIEIDSADEHKVSPTVPHFGGPTGLRSEGLPAGAQVYSYGNSALRQGVSLFSPKQGVNLGDGGDGFTHQVVTLSPGVPGDSGSGFLDSEGRAFGVLSTLSLTPLPGSNGVSDLAKALDYLHSHVPGDSDLKDVKLERGGGFSGGSPLGL